MADGDAREIQAESGSPADRFAEHQAGLLGHCYRMLGSITEAEDALQETMIRAWRAFDRFEGRSTVRSWLYRIATRVCLDHLEARKRRATPMDFGPAGDATGPLPSPLTASEFVEPVPDALVLPTDADPAQRALLRESVRLAFVAALQHLPGKQRAVLLLREVLGWQAAEVAECLDTTVASVNSALQRARATLAARDVSFGGALSAAQSELLERYVAAFERYDIPALTSLLREDATMSMPPYALWLRGPDAVAAWFLGHGSGCRGSRLIPTSANGAPAFGQYRPSPDGGHQAWALIVLEVADSRITSMCSFLDTRTLFPRFGLPMALPPA